MFGHKEKSKQNQQVMLLRLELMTCPKCFSSIHEKTDLPQMQTFWNMSE